VQVVRTMDIALSFTSPSDSRPMVDLTAQGQVRGHASNATL
jgi:hypothetical protein